MRKEPIAEQKSYKESSDSGYTLDNLDLLNLPLSIFAAKHQQGTVITGSGDATKPSVDVTKKSSKQSTKIRAHNNSGESNEIPCQLVPIETKPSLVCLYNNRNSFNRDGTHKTISDEFLVPIYKKRKISPVNNFSSQTRFGSGDYYTNHNCNLPESTQKFSFPFKQTPSGNLKVDARQVAFQSDRVSVLVADPLTTTVNIRNTADFLDVMPKGSEYTKSTAMDAIMTQGLSSSLGSLLAGRLDAPVRKEKESSEYEGRDTESILDPELNLNRLGYTASEVINWMEVTLPEKKNLYLELYSRITNFSNADCKVYIDNEEFNCHLIVLQCYSEVFDNYVAVKKVELPADRCSPSSFAFIYEWMITGDPSYKELNRENALDIFNAAKYLKIKDLIEQCWAFIDNTEVFTEDTAFLLYVDAKTKSLPEVRELMLPRIQKFFLMLVSSQDWLDLDLEDVKNFLTSNYICVNCEMEVFMSAVRWLKHDFASRNKCRVELFSCIRFGNIAPWQLVDIKRNPDNPDFSSLATDPEICKMIDDGLAFVIIKYWYGQENDDFQHWNSILALKEPVVRNWSGMEKTYFTYREFLIYLDQYRRMQMMEKSKPKEKRRTVNVKSGKCSPRQSDDKLSPKVPTADEFLASRKGNVSHVHKKVNNVVS